MKRKHVMEIQQEIEVTAINDCKKDFLVRLAKLVPSFNVVQLKKMETIRSGIRIIELGVQTDTIDKPYFHARAYELGLQVELKYID